MRLDGMRTVAARAIDDLDRAATHRQAVIAVGERLEGIGGEAVFFGQADGGMAGGAHLLGDVACVYRGSRIGMREDLVLAVAIGADRRVEIALAQGDGVHAEVVFRRLGLVAFCAGLGQVGLLHARTGDHRLVHFVAAVAIDAVGGLHDAARQRRAMHTLSNEATNFAPSNVRSPTAVFLRWQDSQRLVWASLSSIRACPPGRRATGWRWQSRQAGASFMPAASARPWAEARN